RQELGLVAQDSALELLQLLAGFDAELAAERLACPPVLVERFGLPSGSVESEHQLAAQPFPKRVLGHERLELGSELRMAGERQVRLDPVLESRESPLLEPRRRPAPEGEGRLELARGCLRIAGVEPLAARARELLEPIEVELAILHAERVAGGFRDQAVGAEPL